MTKLPRFFSLVLSALLVVGPSVCDCALADHGATSVAEDAHACCPSSDDASSPDRSHSPDTCSHCASALRGTVENPRTIAEASLQASPALVPACAAALSAPRTTAVVSVRPVTSSDFHPPSPERLHVSLLI